MRVLLADSNHAVLQQRLTEAGFSCDAFYDQAAPALMQVLPNYDVLVLRSKFLVDKQLLDSCPKLKCIGRVGAGMENIDLVYAQAKGIICLSVPEGNRDAVGEHALGMLLMLLNHLKKADLEVRGGIWLRAENRGTEIMGKTIGIIGYGNTGKAFAKKLSGLDCRILAHDKYLKTFSDGIVKESTLEQIFQEADIVSLHLPLTAETKHYANGTFFKSFQKNVFFINTARGPCVDTSSLVKALREGKVKGACLDVHEIESASFEGPKGLESEDFQFLIHSDQVVLSPHIAGWTHESNYKMSRMIAEKIIQAFPSLGRNEGIAR